MSTKEKIYQLIDQIQDENLLKAYLDLLQKRFNEVVGHLWNSLNDEEKNELLMAYDESENPENLISHEAMKEKYKKALENLKSMKLFNAKKYSRVLKLEENPLKIQQRLRDEWE